MRQLSWLLAALLAGAAGTSTAQQVFPGAPGYPPGGFWGGGYVGASTAAGSALQGMSQVIGAAGQRNLANSEAAKNYTQARSQDYDNRLQWTQTYQQIRLEHKQFQKEMIGPRLSDEGIARAAKVGIPNRLSPSELDPLTGHIQWPIILREDQYAAERTEIEKLFAERASMSVMSPTVFEQIQTSTTALLDSLKKNIKNYRSADWIPARKFVESLAYEIRFPATG